ncbi:hypothetical protein C6V05_08070 [Burkholderia multivorans]|nr:hypothetical protein C6V05_08070 [Burkholderia multivorans]
MAWARTSAACVEWSALKGLEALCFLSVSGGVEAKRDAGAREIGSLWAHWRVARIFRAIASTMPSACVRL